MRLAAGIVMLAVVLESQTPVDPGAWPPAGVYTRKDGATNPEILSGMLRRMTFTAR